MRQFHIPQPLHTILVDCDPYYGWRLEKCKNGTWRSDRWETGVLHINMGGLDAGAKTPSHLAELSVEVYIHIKILLSLVQI